VVKQDKKISKPRQVWPTPNWAFSGEKHFAMEMKCRPVFDGILRTFVQSRFVCQDEACVEQRLKKEIGLELNFTVPKKFE
jgi:hypothetical protein